MLKNLIFFLLGSSFCYLNVSGFNESINFPFQQEYTLQDTLHKPHFPLKPSPSKITFTPPPFHFELNDEYNSFDIPGEFKKNKFNFYLMIENNLKNKPPLDQNPFFKYYEVSINKYSSPLNIDPENDLNEAIKKINTYFSKIDFQEEAIHPFIDQNLLLDSIEFQHKEKNISIRYTYKDSIIGSIVQFIQSISWEEWSSLAAYYNNNSSSLFIVKTSFTYDEMPNLVNTTSLDESNIFKLLLSMKNNDCYVGFRSDNILKGLIFGQIFSVKELYSKNEDFLKSKNLQRNDFLNYLKTIINEYLNHFYFKKGELPYLYLY